MLVGKYDMRIICTIFITLVGDSCTTFMSSTWCSSSTVIPLCRVVIRCGHLTTAGISPLVALQTWRSVAVPQVPTADRHSDMVWVYFQLNLLWHFASVDTCSLILVTDGGATALETSREISAWLLVGCLKSCILYYVCIKLYYCLKSG